VVLPERFRGDNSVEEKEKLEESPRRAASRMAWGGGASGEERGGGRPGSMPQHQSCLRSRPSLKTI
jgi:hypothetical protein